MRADQLQPSASGWCSSTLTCQRSSSERRAGGGSPTVPNLPGRAKRLRLRPYPTSRRRRRR